MCRQSHQTDTGVQGFTIQSEIETGLKLVAMIVVEGSCNHSATMAIADDGERNRQHLNSSKWLRKFREHDGKYGIWEVVAEWSSCSQRCRQHIADFFVIIKSAASYRRPLCYYDHLTTSPVLSPRPIGRCTIWRFLKFCHVFSKIQSIRELIAQRSWCDRQVVAWSLKKLHFSRDLA